MQKNPEKIHVLFVCLGNICRSPMAEAIFKHLVEEKHLTKHFHIDSAGTSGYHEGESYHSETQVIVKKNGIAIHGQSRPVAREDFTKFDYIIAMDTSNFSDLCEICPSDLHDKISHMLEFSQQEHIPGLDVPDPYYLGRSGFEQVFILLMDACSGLLQKIIEENELARI